MVILLEKEFLAVVFACDKFRPYIVDSKVTIHTNHAAIKYLMENMLGNIAWKTKKFYAHARSIPGDA